MEKVKKENSENKTTIEQMNLEISKNGQILDKLMLKIREFLKM